MDPTRDEIAIPKAPPARPQDAIETFYPAELAADDVASGIVRLSAPVGFDRLRRYGAFMSVDFTACEQTKARSMASLPVTVMRFDGVRNTVVRDHPIARILNGMANEAMTSAALQDWTTLRRDVFGNAYWYIEWRKGVPVAIWPVTATVTRHFVAGEKPGRRVQYVVSPGDDYVPAGAYFTYEVVSIPTHMTKDGVRGIPLARLAAEQIGLSIDLEAFYRSMLRNGNHHLGHVEVPAGHMKKGDMDALRTAVDAKAGIAPAGRAPIFGYGAKWVANQQTMKDASVIDQQRWVLEQVCRACNVPPWKVYETRGATYNGGQQMRIDYVTDTVVPDVRVIEQVLQPAIDMCGIPGCSAKFNVNGLMRGDDATRTQYYRELGYLGAISREDIRDKEDLPYVRGLEKPLFPLNYGTVNEDGSVNVYSSKAPAGTADGNQEGVTNV